MGILRILLSIAVLFGHGSGMGFVGNLVSNGFIHPYYAVQFFFCISGFYMSLILSGSYNEKIYTFYINRYLRIAIPYFFVASITFMIAIISKNILPINGFCRNLSNIDLVKIIFVNMSIFFQDVIACMKIAGNNGMAYMLVPQAWSLASELLFYLIAPFIVKKRNTDLIFLILLFGVLRFAFIFNDFTFFPWQQKIFVLELPYFLVGILSHRMYRKYFENSKMSLQKIIPLFIVLSLITLIGNKTIPIGSNSINDQVVVIAYGIILILILGFSLPYIFQISRHNKFDRLIGNLSYPIYLWHIVLAYTLPKFFNNPDISILLLFTLVASVGTFYFIEIPLNKLRQNILTGRTLNCPPVEDLDYLPKQSS